MPKSSWKRWVKMLVVFLGSLQNYLVSLLRTLSSIKKVIV